MTGKKGKTFWEEIEERFEKIIREMEERIDKTMEEATEFFPLEKPLWNAEKCCLTPLIEVQNLSDEIILMIDLPYVEKKGDIELDATEKTVEIKAKLKRPYRFEGWGTVQKEIDFRTYRRKIKLPEEIIPEKAQATFKNGILKVKLPKKVKAKKIRID